MKKNWIESVKTIDFPQNCWLIILSTDLSVKDIITNHYYSRVSASIKVLCDINSPDKLFTIVLNSNK